MKIKTVVVSVVVSAALIAGAGYGAYYAMQGRKSPVEVVPVSNVNVGGYWGTDDSIYGTVTSQVAQNITLDEEYSIAEIYVEVGDQVQEGTPLFAYDMTLQELELEMEQLNLQVNELTMTKLEKDLEKLKATPATASLEQDGFSMTTASDEAIVIEDMEVIGGEEEAETTANDSDTEAGGSTETVADGSDAETGQSAEAGNGDESEESSGQTGGTQAVADGEIEIETIETMEAREDEKARLVILDSVTTYEQVVLAVDSLFRAYGEELQSEDVADAIEEAVAYYLKHLAEEQVTTVTDEAGNPVEQKSYVIRSEVQEALGEEGTATLMEYSALLSKYQVSCTEMMIAEASALEGEALAEAVVRIEVFYDAISSEAQKEIENIDQLTVLKTRAESQEAVITDLLAEETLQEGSYDAQPLEDEQSGTDSQAESQSGAEQEAESQSSSTEQGTETQSEVLTESEPVKTYIVEVQAPGSANVSSAAAGDTIVLHTDGDVPGTEFAGWTAESDGTVLDLTVLENLDPEQTDTSFVMPAMNVKLIPNYRIVPSEIDGFITTYEELAAKATADGAESSEDYVTMLGDVISYYQQWLAEVSAEILDETASVPTMEQYQLKTETRDYLTEQNREADIEQLEASYKQICIAYVKVLVTSLNPQALTRDAFETASEAYQNLGITWQAELEEEWMEEQTAKLEQTAQTQTEAQTEAEQETDTDNTDETEAVGTTDQTVLTLAELLQSYEVILIIQELDQTKTEELLRLDLIAAQEKYMALTDAQKQIVWNANVLIELLKSYNMWEQQEETEASGIGDYDFDDGGYADFSESYTAAELKEMIEDKEREIKECDLSIREAELAVKQCQRVVDGKIVKSTMEGTVVSIGDLDGNSDDDYFAKVTNEEGLYAKGSMNELALESIHVGDTISGMMMDTGVSFTAVIKEISEYPTADNDSIYYGYGTENTNASYYPFYALLDDTTDIDEGEAEIQLSATMTSSADAIYLEKYFVRSDNTGKSYVYIQGTDGKLKKQYVTTGKLMYGFALEISSGLRRTDKIAFPYGNDVFEGAATKEVDMLSAYM